MTDYGPNGVRECVINKRTRTLKRHGQKDFRKDPDFNPETEEIIVVAASETFDQRRYIYEYRPLGHTDPEDAQPAFVIVAEGLGCPMRLGIRDPSGLLGRSDG